MKRAPIVLAATAAGLAGVLGFHTEQPGSGLASGLSSGQTTSTTSPDSASTTTTTTSPGGTATGSRSPSTTTTTTTSGETRIATGDDVQYRYGELELEVTVTGTKITRIEPVIDTAYDARSYQVNSFAEPQLDSQALAAQSANINGVSGATFTSQAYVQSLQAALDKLGVK
ncbi:MAG: FMN-binding protein [Acidimicrobiales bacterium]|jgi:uncharacterized protein with FMN-binding domain